MAVSCIICWLNSAYPAMSEFIARHGGSAQTTIIVTERIPRQWGLCHAISDPRPSAARETYRLHFSRVDGSAHCPLLLQRHYDFLNKSDPVVDRNARARTQAGFSTF